MTEIPKYNFKKIEDLLTESSEVNTQKNSNRRNSQSSHKSYRNLNSSNNQSLRNTSLKRNKSPHTIHFIHSSPLFKKKQEKPIFLSTSHVCF
jgi:hypothetical protein